MFRKKIDNKIAAEIYRDKLLIVLDDYRMILISEGRTSEIFLKTEIIQLFIHFQYDFHRNFEINEKMVARVHKKFELYLKRENKSVEYLDQYSTIIKDFFNLIVKNYNQRE